MRTLALEFTQARGTRASCNLGQSGKRDKFRAGRFQLTLVRRMMPAMKESRARVCGKLNISCERSHETWIKRGAAGWLLSRRLILADPYTRFLQTVREVSLTEIVG